MKNVIAALALLCAVSPSIVLADENTCGIGEVWQDEISHVETIVDEEAYTEYVSVGGNWWEGTHGRFWDGWAWVYFPQQFGGYKAVEHEAVTHEETVIDQEAGCVDDPNYEEEETSTSTPEVVDEPSGGGAPKKKSGTTSGSIPFGCFFLNVCGTETGELVNELFRTQPWFNELVLALWRNKTFDN